jgi:Kdo2-lipid IVA lauroyltransferase/acyltransferase
MSPEARLPSGKRLRYALQAGPVLGLLALARTMNVDRASALGGRLGRQLAARPLRRPATIATIRTAFPEFSEAEAVELIGVMAENLGRTVAESAHLDKFMGGAGRARFTFEGLDHLERARSLGRPLLVISGHFGNWEVIFPAMHHAGIAAGGITRRPNNPYLADWFANNRSRLGFDQQYPKGSEGTRQMLLRLKQGGDMAMLVDQHLAQGVPAPLFGQPAMTVHTPAVLALRHGVIVLPIGVRREPDGARFRAVFHAPLALPGTGTEGGDILAMTTALNAFVEAEVRARPGHWLWMHQRFKPVATLSPRAARVSRQGGE